MGDGWVFCIHDLVKDVEVEFCWDVGKSSGVGHFDSFGVNNLVRIEKCSGGDVSVGVAGFYSPEGVREFIFLQNVYPRYSTTSAAGS